MFVKTTELNCLFTRESRHKYYQELTEIRSVYDVHTMCVRYVYDVFTNCCQINDRKQEDQSE